MTNKKVEEQENPKVQVALDHVSYADKETVDAIKAAFPIAFRPHLSMVVQMTESAGGALPYFVLSVYWGVAWVARCVFKPSLDEVGFWLRDSVRAYMKRRRDLKWAQGHFRFENVEFRVSVAGDTLVSWPDQTEVFALLRRKLEGQLADPTVQIARWVSVYWDDKAKEWVFHEIEPRDMVTRRAYFSYNRQIGVWEEKRLW